MAALDWFGGTMGYGGKRASGGNVSAGKFFEVNERAPELLDVNGRQFLMMGKSAGNITPNHQLRDSDGGGGGGGFNQHNTFVIQERKSRDTQSQIAARVRRETNAAAAKLA